MVIKPTGTGIVPSTSFFALSPSPRAAPSRSEGAGRGGTAYSQQNTARSDFFEQPHTLETPTIATEQATSVFLFRVYFCSLTQFLKDQR